METHPSRRGILASGALLGLPAATWGRDGDDAATKGGLADHFPAQNPARVREMVAVSHGNIGRVRELLEESPALAKATWDWGFGDWEAALGAASHVGNRGIADLLIANGARPDLFTFAMFGQLNVVKSYIEANPGIQRTLGPHGITLLAHAQHGGDPAAAVVRFLETLGDANVGVESLPLTSEQEQAYIGEYVVGPGENDLIVIAKSRRGSLAIRRGRKGTPRNLLHHGEHRFSPAGARDVRVVFDVRGERAWSVTVHDPGPIVTGRRR